MKIDSTEMNKVRYVSEMIGEDYKNWLPGQAVFINTPTGSGKTTFVLDNLLEHAIKNNKRILYLVNRSMLKRQLEEIIETKKSKIRNQYLRELENNIVVQTYQALEYLCKNSIGNVPKGDCYDYIIADEVHYFLADSTFNTDTQISYDWLLNNCFHKKATVVYMSATINGIKELLIQDYYSRYELPSVNGNIVFGHNQGETREEFLKRQKDIIEYSDITRNGDIRIHLFDKAENLLPAIKDSKRKWIFFVDNKDEGNKIKKYFQNAGVETVFIAAGYKNSEEEMDVVNNIAVEQKFKQQILIATSVLDNGVSLQDPLLENMVIMTDTKEEFLQMMGRKRFGNSGEYINLYICPRSKEHFSKRLNLLNQVEKTLNKVMSIKYSINVTPLVTYNLNSFVWWQYYNDLSCQNRVQILRNIQTQLLENLMISKNFYENVRMFLFPLNEFLYCNRFSYIWIEQLKDFYKHMISEMETDQYAFAKLQAKWIDVAFTENMVTDYESDTKTKCIQRIINILEGSIPEDPERIILDEPMTEAENIKLKELLKDDLRKVLQLSNMKYPKQNHITDLGKNDRPLSEKNFNNMMIFLNIGYQMRKENKKFVIYKSDDNMK